jgi:hypothetical protein
VLQGNFTAEDGYAAARISIAEMLLTGTTCFLESMVGVLSESSKSLKLTHFSLLIGTVSMACVVLLKSLVFAAA